MTQKRSCEMELLELQNYTEVSIEL